MKQGERVIVKQSVSSDTHRGHFAGMTGILKKRVAAGRTRGGSGYYVKFDSGETVKFFKDELTTEHEINRQKLEQLRKSLTDHDLKSMKAWCGWVLDDRIRDVSEYTGSVVLALIEAFEITVKENGL